MNENWVSTSTADDFAQQNGRQPAGWSMNDVYDSEISIQEMMDTLEVIAKFRKKYPNDDIIQGFELIVRDEICSLFGGSIEYED